MDHGSAQPIAVGTRLGQFLIGARLGAGGMGEVYDAEDTRLHRHVALKVIHSQVASDPVRRARLEREASAVAMLNHPHIVTVHSLDEHEGTLFITMELIEGSTLANLLPAHGFPLDRLLVMSMQLADALGAAHAAGIIHRDLKPTNVMVTREGAIKVLDFGLSRLALEQGHGAAVTETLTIDGHLVGTAPYMSPEQIEGRAADARSDLFSLGVVMFEMATGKRPFNGSTSLATLTAIVKDAAPFASDINTGVPEELARIIDRCLMKDPARRMQSAVDVHGQLEDLAPLLESRGSWLRNSRGAVYRRRALAAAKGTSVGWRAAAAVMSIAALMLVGFVRYSVSGETAPAVDQRVTRFTVDLPKGQVIGAEFNPHVALSPDGSQLAIAGFPGPVSIRRFDGLETRVLPASEGPGFRGAPLFSPDGASISFIQGNAVFSWARPFYKAAVSGGAAVKLADYDAFHKGDWSADGWIYWTANYPGGIVRIRDSGGKIEPVTELDLQRGERSHRFASLLPGGTALLYTVAFDGISNYDDARIDLWDSVSRERKTLIVGGTSARYSPSGHIVYARAGKLLAVPFDPSRREVTGAPFEVLDGVLMSGNTGAAEFSLSPHGDLAYVPGSAVDGHRTLVWVDRSGKATPLPLPPASYLYPRLSPDGRFLAVEIEGPNHDFYVYDFSRAVLTKMTTDGLSHDPVWTPDGKQLVFRSWQAGGMTMWMMPADRSAKARRLDPKGARQSPVSVSPDGRFLTFDQKDPQTRDDAWVLPLGDNLEAQPVAQSRFGEGSAKFSPDGHWIAYASDESGKAEVYVQPFPGPGPKVQISSGGGFDPVWKRTGGEIYYRNGTRMMVTAVAMSRDQLRAGAPRTLWEGRYSDGFGSSCGMPGVSSSNYDVTSDGQRFLMVRDDDYSVVGTRVVVALNWATELRARSTR